MKKCKFLFSFLLLSLFLIFSNNIVSANETDNIKITGPGTLYIDRNDFLNVSYLKQFYTIKKNNEDVSFYSYITNDNYSGNGNKIGNYNFKITYESQGLLVNVNVVNGFNGYFIGDKTIYIANDRKLSNANFLKAFEIISNVKFDNTYKITFDGLKTYNSNFSKIGHINNIKLTYQSTNGLFGTLNANYKIVSSKFFREYKEDKKTLKKLMSIIFGIILFFGIAFLIYFIVKKIRRRK